MTLSKTPISQNLIHFSSNLTVDRTLWTIHDPGTPSVPSTNTPPSAFTGWQAVMMVVALSIAAAAGAETAAVSIAAAVFGSRLPRPG
jgi:hypothetical protein